VADDDFGQPIHVWADLFTDKACRIWRQETGRPFELTSPTTGEVITAEFEIFFGLDADTYNSSTGLPTFDEQARIVITSPYDLVLNVELVSVRADRKAEHHIEAMGNRSLA